MDHDSPEVIRSHVKVYLVIFGILIFMTFVTVGLNKFHMPFHWAVVAALAVASFKVSLVGGFFMHLIGEKKIIHWTLLSIVIFFIALMMIPSLTTNEAVTRHIAPPTHDIVRHHAGDSGDHPEEPAPEH